MFPLFFTTTRPNCRKSEVSVDLDNHAVFVKEIGAKIPTNLSDGNGETSRTVSAILEAGATKTLSFPIALTQTGEAKWNWKVRFAQR